MIPIGGSKQGRQGPPGPIVFSVLMLPGKIWPNNTLATHSLGWHPCAGYPRSGIGITGHTNELTGYAPISMKYYF